MSAVNRYQVPPEKQKLLDISSAEALLLHERALLCPRCSFRIEGVYSDSVGHLNVKCQKCKWSGVVNLSYFRRRRIFM